MEGHSQQLDLRLLPTELEGLLMLYQKVELSQKALIAGQKSLDLIYKVVDLLRKATYLFVVVYKKKPPTGIFPNELIKLLDITGKIQWLEITGLPPSSAVTAASPQPAPTEGTESHEDTDVDAGQHPSAIQGRRRYDTLDFSIFSQLHSLHLKHIECKQMCGVHPVAELTLTDAFIEGPLNNLSTLRAIQYNRSLIDTRTLPCLCYSLRSFDVVLSVGTTDAPWWRLPPPEDTEDSMMPYELLTTVRINGSRVLFRKLDNSWEKLVNLTTLVFTNVNIHRLDTISVIQRCVNLVSLDLSHNKLSQLDSIAVIAPGAVKLNVAYNRIQNLNGIPQLAKLRQLNLEGNDISEWADIRDVADGCILLSSLRVKGNPITRRFKSDEDVIPFTAYVFQFKNLTVDGVPISGARSKATPELMAMYLPLFERNRGPLDNASSRASSRGRPHRSKTGGSIASSRHFHTQPINASFESKPENTRRYRSSHVTTKKGNYHYQDIMVDKGSNVLELPQSQIDKEQEDEYARKLDIDYLSQKHGEKWLTAASTITKSYALYSQPEPSPEPREATPEDKPSDYIFTEEKNATSARRHHGEHRHHRRYHRDRKGSPPAGNNNPSQNVLSALESAHAFQEQLKNINAQSNKSLEFQSTAPRQPPAKPPVPLFQQFLDTLGAVDWIDTDQHGNPVKPFPSGLSFYTSAIGEENQAIWEVDKGYDMNPGVMEVLLHDGRDMSHTYANRFVNRTLIRLVEHHSGLTRYLRVERKLISKNGTGTSFSANYPVTMVMLGATTPTQPLDLLVQVCSFDENIIKDAAGTIAGRNASSRRSGSMVEFKTSEFVNDESGKDGVDVIKAGRQLQKVSKPKLVMAFIVPKGGVTTTFLSFLKEQLTSCQSRLCGTGILKSWPLNFDDSAAVREKDRCVPLKITAGYVKERMTHYTHVDMDRQRVGCQTSVRGSDLMLILQTYVFPTEVALDRCGVMCYANVLTLNAKGDEWEESNILCITKHALLLAEDCNFAGANPKNAPEGYFPNPDSKPLSTLTQVEVSFNLQVLRFEFGESESYVIFTRDASTTLAILNALSKTSEVAKPFLVRPCLYPQVTKAPLIFSLAVYLRPLTYTKPKKVSDRKDYPMRHVREDMLPVTLVFTSTEVIIFSETAAMSEYEDCKERARKSLTQLFALKVASQSLFPLIFALEIRNEKNKMERWIMCGQHTSSVALVHSEIRQHCPKVVMEELTQGEYDGTA